jgi:hypothetical protein
MSDVEFRNWDTDKLKAALKAKLLTNGEAVGAYVERDARRRLFAITEPEWGQGYRRHVVGRLLTHSVEEEPNGVVIKVGVEASPDSRHHGYYIETGSREAPAHPFLRPAVFENRRVIVGLLAQ